MKYKLYFRMNATVLVSFIMLSCSSTKHYRRDIQQARDLYRSESTDTTNMANQLWQDMFSDPILDSLIAEGLDNNTDLQRAIRQLMIAESGLKQSKAALFPTLNTKAGTSYTKTSGSNFFGQGLEYNTHELNLQSSWEIDIWGKLNSTKKAAYANMLASDAGQKAVQTRLIANIATAYYSLLALDEKLNITEQTVLTNIDIVETMRALKESGRVTGAAIVQSEASRYAAEVTIPDLKQQIQSLENTLSLLLGRKPGPISRGTLANQKPQAALYIGIPLQVLDNRPDVMQAEYQLMAAYETANSARAYFYPSLTINAQSGLSALEFDELFNVSSLASNLAAGLAAPLFNKRINKTRLEVAKLQKDQVFLSFYQTLLNAGKEVNDAMTSLQASVDKIEWRQKQLEALEKAVEYTRELLNYGSATYTEVLIAQQSFLAVQLRNVDDRTQQLNAIVELYRALGGGWK